ncbi:MAG: DUF1345 domain-containing protein [Betaproteobacteria bacterium]|jgi:uncharacterized membrane protein
MKSKSTFLHLIQSIRSRPRLILALIIAVSTYFVLSNQWASHISTRLIISWNAFAFSYLALSIEMMFASTPEHMQKRAIDQNVGRIAVLFLVFIAALVCITSSIISLSVAKEIHGQLKWEHIALAGMTVFTSWLFTQVMFAQHYAHDYYFSLAHQHDPGLHFPGTAKPDYFDFVYFSCVIGTSAQTADVSFTNGSMRRTGLAHGILAFFFNTILIALTINIGSGLI